MYIHSPTPPTCCVDQPHTIVQWQRPSIRHLSTLSAHDVCLSLVGQAVCDKRWPEI